MRALRMVVLSFVIVGAAACSSSAPQQMGKSTMPNVTGQRLDIAEGNLQRAGVDPNNLTIIGGGTFGVVVKSAWQVCAQSPAAGRPTTSAPQLTIARICPAGNAKSGTTRTTTVPATQPSTATSSPPTTTSDNLDASAIEKAYLGHLANNGISSIKSMCDANHTDWSCFYDGVSSAPGFLRINLTTDGGWSADDLTSMANQAGLAWFNFVGCDFPNLSTIVVTINGIDHNVFRSDSAANSSC